MPGLDLEPLRRAAAPRIGDVIAALGGTVRGSPERGRATAPHRATRDLNISYANGLATDHVSGETYDGIGLVAHVRGLDVRRADGLREAARELAAILGTRVGEEPSSSRPEARRRPQTAGRVPSPSRDAGARWRRMAPRDPGGESYLAGRRVLPDLIPNGILRFNVGASGDRWLDARAAEGYWPAFAVWRPDGSLATIVLRFAGPAEPPETYGKAPALPGCPTAGAAICRPEVALLATGDPEFSADEIVVTEGPTDTLAATLAFDLASCEQLVPPTWALGAVGVGNVVGMLQAFRNVVSGRTVHIALDTDAAGEAAIPGAAAAAREAGARRVTRMRPPDAKDIAEAWSACV